LVGIYPTVSSGFPHFFWYAMPVFSLFHNQKIKNVFISKVITAHVFRPGSSQQQAHWIW
jgi:hypothetical protein